MSEQEKERALSILREGYWFRLMDGRCSFGFVDPDVLREVVADGDAEILDNQGVEMVRALPIES